MVNYRAYVGKESEYDLRGALQFCVAVMQGLRDKDYLLDVGCGSLRGGRLFIPYLLPGRYHGVDMRSDVIEAGLRMELGDGILEAKSPMFLTSDAFEFAKLRSEFDMILINAVLCHLGPEDAAQCIAMAGNVLARGGVILASYHEGKPSPGGRKPVYPEVRHYRFEDLENWAEKIGLRCERLEGEWFDITCLDETWDRMQWVEMDRAPRRW